MTLEPTIQKVHVDKDTYSVCARCHRKLDKAFVVRGDDGITYIFGIDCKETRVIKGRFGEKYVGGTIVQSYEMIRPDNSSLEGQIAIDE